VTEILFQESTAHLEKLAGEQMPEKNEKNIYSVSDISV